MCSHHIKLTTNPSCLHIVKYNDVFINLIIKVIIKIIGQKKEVIIKI